MRYKEIGDLQRLRAVGEWRPVAEMTPELKREIRDWLLVVVEDTRDGDRVVRLATYDPYGKYWRSQWDRITRPYRVTYWMLLPELPERGEGDDGNPN